MKILFVDGYNVINSWPNLKMNKDEDFDGVRKSLTDSMHTYAVYNNYKVIIVFDAYKVKGSQGEVQKYHNIYVVYRNSIY